MKSSLVSIALTAVVLVLSTASSWAVDKKTDAPPAVASQALSDPKVVGSKAGAKPKAAGAVKLVDINSAKKEELKTLAGISDAAAAKIIAGRPYGSKAWLVSRGILSQKEYWTIRQLIIAKQPFKDAAKNAALYKNKP